MKIIDRMMRRMLAVALGLTLLPLLLAAAEEKVKTEPMAAAEPAVTPHSPLHQTLWYIPNRVFDALDIFRVRVRVGGGLAVGARATEFADFFFGSYLAFYAGLPGPRHEPIVPRIVGAESNSGVEVSVVDATTGLGIPPKYGATEFGAGFQLFIAGLDLGIDPGELVDFLAGLIRVDYLHDDL